MSERFARWDKAANEAQQAVAVSRQDRKRAERKVDRQMGVPSNAHITIIWILAGFAGLGVGIIPGMWALVLLGNGMNSVTLVSALLIAGVHLLIAYALSLMARYYGLSTRGHWLWWTALSAWGLLIGWLAMRRNPRAEYFRNRRRELIEEEMAGEK